MAQRVVRIFTCDFCGKEDTVPEGENPPYQEITIRARNLETGQYIRTEEVLTFHHGCVPEYLRVIDFTPEEEESNEQ